MPICEWCGAEDEEEHIYTIPNAVRTYPDGKEQDPAQFIVCRECMALAIQHGWDELCERVEQRKKGG